MIAIENPWGEVVSRRAQESYGTITTFAGLPSKLTRCNSLRKISDRGEFTGKTNPGRMCISYWIVDLVTVGTLAVKRSSVTNTLIWGSIMARETLTI